MEGKRGNDLQALTEIADNDVPIVDTAGGTRAITYAQLCAAVKDTLGIREVVESTNITEPGFLMDGKTASEAFAELYSKILKFKTYDNKSGTSTTNSHIRTQEIIEASCEYDGQPFLLLIQNPEGSNELLLIYDIGYPYVVGLKITYYGGSAGPRMVLYRRITTEWNTPQIINTTKAT